ncbi:natterin-3-like [Epinephelus fuscoguttatus]|uniref:natterin-3-like n=1 Tax=Epinephelus fuscoguttatus TaxID=293821 RepID=UPI0020D1D1BB|nr:natterin-3-like [Epinephelus fuscoguttatus]
MALHAPSSDSLNSCEEEDDEPVLALNPDLEDKVPNFTAIEPTDQLITATTAVVLRGIQNNLNQSSSKIDQTNLEWQTFDGTIPKGAVSIYNGYVGRTDYVAKYKCTAGFYNPDKGPYCLYPYGEKEHQGSPFEILVNKDNFEFLEWKDGSYGSVPQNSVKTGPEDVYVAKNMYGLGKVHVKHKAFFLPWEGYEYWYKTYQVLTYNNEVVSEHITDVKYKTDDVDIIKYPPENMRTSVISNRDSRPVTQTVTLSKKFQVEKKWDHSFSLTAGVRATITAGIPLIGSTEIEISASTTYQFTKGTTYVEATDHTVSIEQTVPPKHQSTVRMVGYKYGAAIPYTARVCRTYRNGETSWTSISGTYKSVQIGKVCGVVDPSEPLS